MVGLGGSGEVSSAGSYDHLPDKRKAHPRMGAYPIHRERLGIVALPLRHNTAEFRPTSGTLLFVVPKEQGYFEHFKHVTDSHFFFW